MLLEKGSEVGAHILSGAVIDPVGLNALIPDWKAKGAPLETEVTEDHFIYLGPAGDMQLPNFAMPPLMNNHGNYIGSLGQLCRWLGEQATELGVEIYPGFAAAEVLYDDKGAVTGVATGDMGIGKDGKPNDSFTRGMELKGRYTVIAEGVRGSLAKQLIAKFDLDADCEPQKFGIGIKELWEVKPEQHQPGLVQHTLGWPLDNNTGGGSFLYHYGENLVSVGFVVHLNYENPYLSPFEEFQRFKTHDVHPRRLRGRQAHRLRRARDHRRRLAVDPEAGVPRAACWPAARRASSTCRASRAATTPSCPASMRRSRVRSAARRAARTTGSTTTRRRCAMARSRTT